MLPKFFLALAICLWVTPALSAADRKSPTIYESALRPEIRDYVSSGTYLALGLGSDLVKEPEIFLGTQAEGQVSATLASRVGINIRMGDDPSELPSNRRHQAEPHIARHPMNPRLVVGTFQEGRFTDGGAVNCGYAISADGGLTWDRALIPGLTTVSGGTVERASDPVAAVDHLGNIYLNTLGFTPSSTGLIYMSKSSDGGNSFEAPVVAVRPPNSGDFLDKNWVAVNSFAATPTAGRVFTTFTNFRNNDTGFPIMASYSDDGGETWLQNPISITPQNSFCQGSQPVYLPDGDLAVVYWNFISDPVGPNSFIDDRIEVRISQNGGNSFGTSRVVAANFQAYDDPVLRGGGFLPSVTADRTEGVIFVAYQAVVSGVPKVMFTRSANNGATWSTPRAVSNNPSGSSIATPAITVSADGEHVTIVFLDTRDNAQNGNLFHLYLAESLDGGDSWEPNNTRLSELPTNALLAPLTPGGRMLGDYLGVVPALAGNSPGVAIWIDTRTGSPDPFGVAIDRPFPDPFGGDEITGIPEWNSSPWYENYFTDIWPWIFHDQHGWQWVYPGSESGAIFVWDFGLNEWLFLNESTYRWVYLFGDNPGWIWSFPGGGPGERLFARADDGCVFSETTACGE